MPAHMGMFGLAMKCRRAGSRQMDGSTGGRTKRAGADAAVHHGYHFFLLCIQVFKGLRRGVQDVAVKKLPARPNVRLLDTIRKEVEVLRHVSYDKHVVQVCQHSGKWKIHMPL
jgi:hypothetical protein